jgi:flagellar basal body rod protein FlgG
MIRGMSASLAGLFAFSNKAAVAANNVANFTTDGYKRTEATISEDSHGEPEVILRKVGTPGPIVQYPEEPPRELSNVDLSQEIPQLVIAQRGYEANLKFLDAQGDMLKTTLDIIA